MTIIKTITLLAFFMAKVALKPSYPPPVAPFLLFISKSLASSKHGMEDFWW